MSATIKSTPTAGSFVNLTETFSGATNTAGTLQSVVQLGSQATGDTWTNDTGQPTSFSKVWSQPIAFAGAPVTLDLTNLPDPGGSVAFSKIRGYRIEDDAAADSGFALAIKSGATNGFVGGGFTAAGVSLPANSDAYMTNRNTAGWSVDASHKTVTFDPGANTLNARVCFWGE